MDSDRLILGIAAVFAGVTALLTVLAFVFRQLFLLFVALPFALTTYFMWYQATGRLEQKARSRGRRVGRNRFEGGAARRGRTGGPGPTGSPGPGGASGPGAGSRRTVPTSSISESEAYRTLGLDPGADREAVKRAYRRRVKEVHPDTDTGSEEEFKKVNRAYELLSK